jgi:glycosyltransferase involved in cell wall biosynthesis
MSNSVSLCMIVKNEEKNIGLLLDVVCPILEQVVIVDTGSTDKTLEILEERRQKYGSLTIEHFKWIDDFAAARNYAFSFATQEWVMFLDGDDYVEPNDLFKFKNQVLGKDQSVDCYFLDYIYGQLPDGTPTCVLGRERLVRRSKNPKWVGAIHETIDVLGMKRYNYKDLKVIHKRDGKNTEPGRNLRILAKEYERDPNNARTAYYYGKELFDHSDPKAVEVLEAYIKNFPHKYYDDHVNALFRLGKHYISVKDYHRALNAAHEIYIVDGSRERAECYWILGQVEYECRNWPAAIEWFERCLRCKAESPRVISSEYYSWRSHWPLVECYKSVGDVKKAFYHLEKVHGMLNYHSGTLRWIHKYLDTDLLPSRKVAVEIDLTNITTISKDQLKIIPNNFLMELHVSEYDEDLFKKVSQRGKMIVHKNEEIVCHIREDERIRLFGKTDKKIVGIYTGPAWEKWSLDNYRDGGSGIGGSEYAAGRLAETMAADGHRVILIGEHDACSKYGVECVNWRDYDLSEEYFDLFITSRTLDPVDERLKAKRILAWIHDTCLGYSKNISAYHRSRVDKFITLSPWHKQYVMSYHDLLDSQVCIIPNGVTTSDFDGMSLSDKPTEKGRIHFSSSPNRGLDNILYMLPWIIDSCPEVKLHVYYGFNNWLLIAQSSNNASEQLRVIDNLQKEMDKYKDHVEIHGRVSQHQLRQDWKKSSLWMMASSFFETYCISALEAQCSFTPSLTTNIAALSTTVGNRGLIVTDNPYSREGRVAFIENASKILTNESFFEEMALKAGSNLDRVDWRDRYTDYWKKYLE